MILSFADQNTSITRSWSPDIQRKVLRRMQLIHAAGDINDLKIPPGLELHRLNHDSGKYWAIRIDEEWRIIFRWKDSNAYEVAFAKYNKQ